MTPRGFCHELGGSYKMLHSPFTSSFLQSQSIKLLVTQDLILITMVSIRSLTEFAVLAVIAGAAAPPISCGSQSLLAYPIPTGMNTKDSFSANIRSLTNNGTWLPLGTYLANLNQINTTTSGAQVKQSSMAQFDFCDSAEVSVTSQRPIKSVVVRPVS